MWKAATLAAVLGLAMVPYPAHAAPPSGSDTVQGLYDVLLSTMKNGRTLGQSGRFTKLEPVIRRTFDIPSMARLSVGSSWASLTEAQRQQVTESFGRYISAIYADRFDNYAGQKLRVTGGDERNSIGVPRVTANCSARNTTNGSDGADAVLRQVSQWQMPLASGSPSTR